jgi:choline kinase
MARHRMGLSVIIPAAGMGRRMKSYGPKSLINLDNRQTVLDRQGELILKAYPKAEIIVVVGHEADLVMSRMSPAMKPVENELYETTNVVRSLSMGMRLASYPDILIVYGDLVFNRDAIENLAGGHSLVVVDNHGRMDAEEVGVTVVDGRITRFCYDVDTKWGQIAYLTGAEASLFKQVAWNRNHSRWYGFEALNRVIELGGRLRPIEPHRMKLAEIDTSRDIENARRIL